MNFAWSGNSSIMFAVKELEWKLCMIKYKSVISTLSVGILV